jgi:hypothetical protein
MKSSEAYSDPMNANLGLLPDYLKDIILYALPTIDLLHVSQVCSRWRTFCGSVWKSNIRAELVKLLHKYLKPVNNNTFINLRFIMGKDYHMTVEIDDGYVACTITKPDDSVRTSILNFKNQTIS